MGEYNRKNNFFLSICKNLSLGESSLSYLCFSLFSVFLVICGDSLPHSHPRTCKNFTLLRGTVSAFPIHERSQVKNLSVRIMTVIKKNFKRMYFNYLKLSDFPLLPAFGTSLAFTKCRAPQLHCTNRQAPATYTAFHEFRKRLSSNFTPG